MATCSQGSTSNITLFNFHPEFKKLRCTALFTPRRTKSGRLEALNGSKGTQIWQEPVHAAGFDKQAQRLTNSLAARCCLSSGTENDSDAIMLEENKSKVDQIIPVSLEVEPLLTAICDTSSISEFKLDLAGFHLYVKRDLVEENVPPPVPILPPAQTNTTNQTADSNGSAATASLAISKPKPSTGGIQRTASDEGLVMLPSPNVGFFRTSRTIKGKRAPPLCKEKQEVKEGQILCCIEQLGGEIPVESDVSGEIVKILRKDGEPVGYGDALIAILPSFPGIKKLQ
ncbi:biotin carboxyl carrier protein of acetyl-CoA carboxylase-like isoform X2 [Phoenix dactylifera]|uniref:Biotin carboxyl carrier protein of acetyl-CoA carboxylase-like isoform X2 n=1 Tax=Phoenix dactylifera TaxID=42345 RepID=A0A8B7D2I2_PHODC|nr:biotin carboxyl carrier protein of acetyl-CoA carboxylase-like isoform X2 [Phoenix dactylifera]